EDAVREIAPRIVPAELDARREVVAGRAHARVDPAARAGLEDVAAVLITGHGLITLDRQDLDRELRCAADSKRAEIAEILRDLHAADLRTSGQLHGGERLLRRLLGVGRGAH